MTFQDSDAEFMILNFSDDITRLGEASRKTNLIDWTLPFEVPFPPLSVANCVKTIITEKAAEADYENDVFVLNKVNPVFTNIRLPLLFSFELSSLEHVHVELVNSKWPHRHANSPQYFRLLIKAKQGYGIFQDGILIALVFIEEMGAFGHLFTLEEHWRKGYGETILKLVPNILLKENKCVIAFCIQKNIKAQSLYRKLGVE